MPKIDLNSLKALIANSDLTIGNDTGPTHIAWAQNIPSITLFGPTVDERRNRRRAGHGVRQPGVEEELT